MAVNFSTLVNFSKMKVTTIKLPASLAACLSVPPLVCLPESIYPSGYLYICLHACPLFSLSIQMPVWIAH